MTKAHYATDAGAALMVGLSFLDAMPKIAALVGAIWYAIQIFEWLRRKLK